MQTKDWLKKVELTRLKRKEESSVIDEFRSDVKKLLLKYKLYMYLEYNWEADVYIINDLKNEYLLKRLYEDTVIEEWERTNIF